ncbi:MAG: HAD family hydrolase [Phycisphaerae bacterium]
MMTPPVKPEWQTNPQAPLPGRIRGLIFDCDGTLVDTMPVHYYAWQMALREAGIPLAEEEFYRLAGMPTLKIAQALARHHKSTMTGEEIAHRKEEAYIQKIPEIKLIEPVVDIARRESGRRGLVVASGGLHRIVDLQLQVAGLAELFPIVICADDVEHGKPAPDSFLLAARRMGVKSDQCVVYEDGELGFQAAAAAGMICIDVRPWQRLAKSEPG